MLLKRNRSSQVKARSVVITPPPQQNRRDFARPAGSHPANARPSGSHPANYRPSERRRTSSGSPVARQPRSDAAPSSGKLGIASPPLEGKKGVILQKLETPSWERLEKVDKAITEEGDIKLQGLGNQSRKAGFRITWVPSVNKERSGREMGRASWSRESYPKDANLV